MAIALEELEETRDLPVGCTVAHSHCHHAQSRFQLRLVHHQHHLLLVERLQYIPCQTLKEGIQRLLAVQKLLDAPPLAVGAPACYLGQPQAGGRHPR
ncbi:hypothetical protein VZO05_07805 [Aggregatilineales bacterium SYSU G02658]